VRTAFSTVFAVLCVVHGLSHIDPRLFRNSAKRGINDCMRAISQFSFHVTASGKDPETRVFFIRQSRPTKVVVLTRVERFGLAAV